MIAASNIFLWTFNQFIIFRRDNQFKNVIWAFQFKKDFFSFQKIILHGKKHNVYDGNVYYPVKCSIVRAIFAFFNEKLQPSVHINIEHFTAS